MRKFFKRKPTALSFLVTLLLVLLSVLAALQYRWLGRVSSGEREAMQVAARTRTRKFCEEFDREITRAYATFKMNAGDFRGENRDGDYAERFDKWLKISHHPGIVKSIFLAESSDTQLHLSRFSETAKTFERVEWTSELESLRKSLERRNADALSQDIFKGGVYSIVEEIPALVGSIASARAVDSKGDRTEVDWQHPLGYVIIALDLNYIKKEVFPALAKTYFSSGSRIDYDLNITSRLRPNELIYKSNPESDFTADSPDADANDKLFNIGFDQVKSYSSERVYETADSSNQDNSDFTLVVPTLKDGETQDAGKILLVNDGARWKIKINHRSGSLDAAVTNARRWNLAMSFGILLLLGVCIVLIAVLSRRSQRLARRQIEFVAGVSHEFRTPLAVIHSLSENLAAGRIKDSLQVELYGATIHKDVRRLTEMVEQVLEFAGAERGKYFYDKNPVDIGRLIEKILAANDALFRETDWSVESRIEPGIPLVSADESALARAVQNLINNAVKYGGGGDRRLKIEAYQAANGQKSEVRIAVEDNGRGISAIELPHIFEPFYRGQQAVDAQIHGSGLGLNLVKQIVEAHGGRITVKSGRGSRFVLHLPTASDINLRLTSEKV
jgi:signal transduction histidine kinase